MGGYHFDVFLALDSMQRRDIPVYLYHYSFIICILFFFGLIRSCVEMSI